MRAAAQRDLDAKFAGTTGCVLFPPPTHKYASFREAVSRNFKDLRTFVTNPSTRFSARLAAAFACVCGLGVALQRGDPLHEWPWTVVATVVGLFQIVALLFFGGLSLTAGETIFRFVLDRLYHRVPRIERARSCDWEWRVAAALGTATTLVVGLVCFLVFYVGVWVTPGLGPRVLSLFEYASTR